MGSKFQSRGSGNVFLRVPACFPEVWRVGEQLAFGPKPELCFYSVKIMPNKHTCGMLPAIFFQYQIQWHVKLLITTNHCKMLLLLWEERTFPVLSRWLQVRFRAGMFPQYRTLLLCLLHGLLTLGLNVFNFGQHRLKHHSARTNP